MPVRPEIFVSTTSQDLRTCRGIVTHALLVLGCVPVVQETFPPDARSVREMLRAKIVDCDAVIHLVGECFGAEPGQPDPAGPRRSYTQMEYDIARELKKPVYTFICGKDFPYDAHEPEPDDKRALQDAHRAALKARDELYRTISDSRELGEHVRELQTRVDKLTRRLNTTRSWLGRGVAITLVVLAAIGLGLWALYHRQQHAETRVAQVTDELDRYRQAIRQIADRYGSDIEPGRTLTESEKFDHALAAVAKDQKISVGELKTWMDLFVTQVRANPGADFYDRALADFAQKRFADAAANATKSAGQFRTQREAAEKETTTAAARAADAREKERRAWTLVGKSEDAAGHYLAAVEPCRQALALYDKEKELPGWCVAALTFERSLSKAGRFAEAEPLVRELIERLTALWGKDDFLTMGAYHDLALLLIQKGDLAGAEALERRTVDALERTEGKEDSLTLFSLGSLAFVLDREGDKAGAETLYRRVLEAEERLLGRDDPHTLNTLNNLAVLLGDHDPAAAEPMLRRVLEGQERILGKEHPETLVALSNLSKTLQAKGDLATAERMDRQVLEASERTLGPDHPNTLGAVTGLALALEAKGDLAGAEALYRRVVAAQERLSGKDNPLTTGTTNHLAGVLQKEGDLAGAETLFRQVLASLERTLGKDHFNTLAVVNSLAGVLQSKGDLAGAEALYRRSLESFERTSGPQSPNTVQVLNNLAALLSIRGDLAAAEPMLRGCLETQERLAGRDAQGTLSTLNNLGRLLADEGKLPEAEPLLRRCLEARERTLGTEKVDTLVTANNLARLLTAKGDYAAAEPIFRRVLEALERVSGKNDSLTLKIACNLGQLLLAKGDDAAAEPYFLRAQKGMESTLPPTHFYRLELDYQFSLLQQKQGRPDRALVLAEQAVAGARQTQVETSPTRLRYEKHLRQLQSVGPAGAR